MKIFLDDVRDAPPGWHFALTATDCIELLENFGDMIEEVSLDHDLGPINEDGYDVLLWIEEQVRTNPDYKLPKLYVHSMNPVAARRMQMAIIAIYEEWEDKHG